MVLYDRTAYELSEIVTRRYSTSFSMASTLFGRDMRRHIFAVYGLVRVADEIVDTYRGPDQRYQLDALERETYDAIASGFSANLIVHSFAVTAVRFGIGRELIEPFFTSMRDDITTRTHDAGTIADYVYGSAEVVGLMCLRVFVDGDAARYEALAPGARRLGSAFQKVNFLRDYGSDRAELGRTYFPQTVGADPRAAMAVIEQDIEADFTAARIAIAQLPPDARPAVATAYRYYWRLYLKLKGRTLEDIAASRIRVPAAVKLQLYAGAWIESQAVRIGGRR